MVYSIANGVCSIWREDAREEDVAERRGQSQWKENGARGKEMSANRALVLCSDFSPDEGDEDSIGWSWFGNCTVRCIR